MEDLSRRCIHTVITESWGIEETAREYAQAGVRGIAVWRETLAGRDIVKTGNMLQHAETTARFTVYWCQGRDRYDVRGRTSHESIFNIRNGSFRCPSTQQGYSPFSTWTRGLAWILSGFAELLEFFDAHPSAELKDIVPKFYIDKPAF